MFSDSLIDWIGNELKLLGCSDKLRLLKTQCADLKTMVTVVLCSADYYTEKEIKELLRTLDEIIGMPPIKRNIVKANHLLKNKQYTDAAGEYERLIDSKEAVDLTPEEYGDIFHNLAVARVHITGIKEAVDIFYQAYERNHREASLRQYLYAIKLSNNPDLYQQKIQDFEISPQLLNGIEEEFAITEEEANHCAGMSDLDQLKYSKADGKINKFYKLADEIIDSWKAMIRQI
jgi:tetratricopeptide (TPR) repeat protein